MGFLRWLAAREDLGPTAESSRPADGAQPRRSAAWLGELLASESLPVDPPPEPGRVSPGLLRFLLVPDPLPRDPQPTPAPGREGVSLRWLFGRERLGDPNEIEDGGDARPDS